VLADKYIVQIDIFCTSQTEVYTNNEDNIYIKKFGSLNLLSSREVLELTKMRFDQKKNTLWKILAQRNLNPLKVNQMTNRDRKTLRSNLEEIVHSLRD
jgi:hypothetical protein